MLHTKNDQNPRLDLKKQITHVHFFSDGGDDPEPHASLPGDPQVHRDVAALLQGVPSGLQHLADGLAGTCAAMWRSISGSETHGESMKHVDLARTVLRRLRKS